jgi:hypothetical protein
MRSAPNLIGPKAARPNARGNGIQFVDTQLGEFDTIECKISIRRIDIEDAHNAIAAHKRFDRVVRSDGRLAEIFFYRLRLR